MGRLRNAVIKRGFYSALLASMAISQAWITLEAQTPNILFIAVDDLNCDLGTYGNRTVVSPNIDQLASEGVRFDNNHCQQPVCGASRASLLSGFTPEHTGITSFRIYLRDLYPDVVTLPQFFKNNGYYTVGMGKIHDPRNVSITDGVDLISWTNFIDISGSRWVVSSGKPVTEMADLPDESYVDGMIAEAGVEQIRNLAGNSEPFFIAVGFKKPHLPFVAPKKYWDLYDRDSISLAPYRRHALNDVDFIHNPGAEFFNSYDNVPEMGTWPADLQREYIHGYYACVSFIDAQVGKLIDELKAQGVYDNTIIVLWGDHGFSLGDHTNWGKHTIFEYATRSPLIFRVPGMTGGTSTASPTEHLDIYPTLVDLAGYTVPDTLDGSSLLPLLDGSRDRVKSFSVSQFRRDGNQGYMLRSDYYQYTEWSDDGAITHRQLFNLAADPYQTDNLAFSDEYSNIVDTFSFHLNRYLDEGINSRGLGITQDSDSLGLYGAQTQLGFSVFGDDETIFPLEDALVTITPYALPTGPAGYTALNLQPGTYQYTIEKEDYWMATGTHELHDTDTVITDTLLRRFYYLTVVVSDSVDGSAISGVELFLGESSAFTDLEGKAAFRIEKGEYVLEAQSEIYRDIYRIIPVRSDTTIEIRLRPEFAYVKFSLYDEGIPVNDALVKLNEDEKLSNAIGMVTFQELPVDSSYDYRINKEGYEELNGNLVLLSDTTLEMEMLPVEYFLEAIMVDSLTGDPLSSVEITLGDSTKYSDQDGITRFYGLSGGTVQIFVSMEGYREESRTIEVSRDTSMIIEMSRLVTVGVERYNTFRCFPNPARNRLHYFCQEPGQLLLVDLHGRTLITSNLLQAGILDISDVPTGVYLTIFTTSTGDQDRSLLFIE